MAGSTPPPAIPCHSRFPDPEAAISVCRFQLSWTRGCHFRAISGLNPGLCLVGSDSLYSYSAISTLVRRAATIDYWQMFSQKD